MMWEVYIKYNKELINIYFWVFIPHPKGENIVWTCLKDHIIDEKDQYKYIGLRGFGYTLFEEEEVGGTREGLGWRTLNILKRYVSACLLLFV